MRPKALELVAHHLEKVGVGGAETVEDDDAVCNGSVGVQVVHPDVDAVVLTGVRLAGSGAENRVDDRAVGIVDDADGIVGGRGGDVGGRRDLA